MMLAVMLAVSILTPQHKTSFDVSKFVLPESAKLLVVVEGTGGTECNVYAYEKTAVTDAAGKTKESWTPALGVKGYLGRNGMNAYRKEGDKTTPIGIFKMNTPFGQKPAQEGFPKNYIQVDESYTWNDVTNRLEKNPDVTGEHVGTSRYAGYYDYVIDAGYNPNAVPKKGTALFLHCGVEGDTETSGCVQVDTASMIEIMKLYGKYGDGACFIAQCPAGKFDLMYDSYGIFGGLSPNGDFTTK